MTAPPDGATRLCLIMLATLVAIRSTSESGIVPRLDVFPVADLGGPPPDPPLCREINPGELPELEMD